MWRSPPRAAGRPRMRHAAAAPPDVTRPGVIHHKPIHKEERGCGGCEPFAVSFSQPSRAVTTANSSEMAAGAAPMAMLQQRSPAWYQGATSAGLGTQVFFVTERLKSRAPHTCRHVIGAFMR
eukprot:2687814-Prymnesium_polylepis.1